MDSSKDGLPTLADMEPGDMVEFPTLSRAAGRTWRVDHQGVGPTTVVVDPDTSRRSKIPARTPCRRVEEVTQ